MQPKYSPLETFLTTVSPSPGATKSTDTADQDVMAGARAVLLTIAGRTGTVPERELKERSELVDELYRDALKGLIQDGLIETSGTDCVLTEAGRAAAERERQRLLSW